MYNSWLGTYENLTTTTKKTMIMQLPFSIKKDWRFLPLVFRAWKADLKAPTSFLTPPPPPSPLYSHSCTWNVWSLRPPYLIKGIRRRKKIHQIEREREREIDIWCVIREVILEKEKCLRAKHQIHCSVRRLSLGNGGDQGRRYDEQLREKAWRETKTRFRSTGRMSSVQ